MSCVLYRMKDKEIVKELVPAHDVAFMLDNGYAADPADLKPKRRKKAEPKEEE